MEVTSSYCPFGHIWRFPLLDEVVQLHVGICSQQCLENTWQKHLQKQVFMLRKHYTCCQYNTLKSYQQIRCVIIHQIQEFIHQSEQERIRISSDAFLPFPGLVAISDKQVKDLIYS